MLHRFFSYVPTTVISDGKTWCHRYIFLLYGIADAITILIFFPKKKSEEPKFFTLNS